MALVCALAACGSSDDGRHIGDGAVDQILISPPDATVTVIDRAAVTQAYTAMLVHPDGSKEDITSTAVFSLADDQYGSFAAQTATLTGGGAGVTHVNALSTSGAVGTTTLTVNVKLTVVGTGVDPGVPDMFDNAAEDASLAPTIVYPNDSILVPPNLGKFDVHWTNNPATNTANVFRSEIANQYIDVKLYTTGIQTDGSPFWDQYAPDAWFPIASSKQQLTLAVAAMNTADPSKKGTSASQHVDVTNENARGGIYYWTSTLQAVYRYDIAAPDVAPAPFFTQGNAPGCMGCHSLSRDGARIAMTTQVGGGPGAVYDVGSQMLIGGTTRQWNFATFNMAADKLVVANTPGEMDLISATDQSLIAMIPPVTPNGQAAAPEISPDNTKLVNVEYTQTDPNLGPYNFYALDGSVVIRSFDDATNTFGAPTTLIPGDASGYNYYPSFSPDSQWILFTKTAAGNYDNATAETWVVKADGSSPPIKLALADTAAANLTNSWPRWVPFSQTFGSAGESLFYLTFSSKRPYGQRIPGGGRPQIWMTPFFPDRAAQGQDPTGAAFRVPFQDVATNNHIAQWTQQVVIQRNANGSLFTASDLQASMREAKAALSRLIP